MSGSNEQRLAYLREIVAAIFAEYGKQTQRFNGNDIPIPLTAWLWNATGDQELASRLNITSTEDRMRCILDMLDITQQCANANDPIVAPLLFKFAHYCGLYGVTYNSQDLLHTEFELCKTYSNLLADYIKNIDFRHVLRAHLPPNVVSPKVAQAGTQADTNLRTYIPSHTRQQHSNGFLKAGNSIAAMSKPIPRRQFVFEPELPTFIEDPRVFRDSLEQVRQDYLKDMTLILDLQNSRNARITTKNR
ncbi:MAG TPA: hypothetical protein VLG38_01495 [Gammaproteobacteria bacterium]|nr:hypothetical protein [Gammaproteobacteria bacterium]